MGVLDDMTKGITARKAEKAGPTLTPVGTEASSTKPSQVGVPDVPEVFLTNEAIADIAKDLREKAAALITVADGLDVLTAKPSVPVEDPKKVAAAEKKVAEKAADSKFAAEYEAKQKAAQAATFTNLDDGASDDEPVTPAPGGWACPDHPGGKLQQLTSRKGRVYSACIETGCERFEK
jgi:hypothetical protein